MQKRVKTPGPNSVSGVHHPLGQSFEWNRLLETEVECLQEFTKQLEAAPPAYSKSTPKPLFLSFTFLSWNQCPLILVKACNSLPCTHEQLTSPHHNEITQDIMPWAWVSSALCWLRGNEGNNCSRGMNLRRGCFSLPPFLQLCFSLHSEVEQSDQLNWGQKRIWDLGDIHRYIFAYGVLFYN